MQLVVFLSEGDQGLAYEQKRTRTHTTENFTFPVIAVGNKTSSFAIINILEIKIPHYVKLAKTGNPSLRVNISLCARSADIYNIRNCCHGNGV